jgi:hypothetical protein
MLWNSLRGELLLGVKPTNNAVTGGNLRMPFRPSGEHGRLFAPVSSQISQDLRRFAGYQIGAKRGPQM